MSNIYHKKKIYFVFLVLYLKIFSILADGEQSLGALQNPPIEGSTRIFRIDGQELFGEEVKINDILGLSETLGDEDQDGFTSIKPVCIRESLDPVDICCGGYSTTILEKDGTVRQFGIVGQGFDEGIVQFSEPVTIKNISCGDYHTLAFTDKGEIWMWGRDNEFLHSATSTKSDSSVPLRQDEDNNQHTIIAHKVGGEGTPLFNKNIVTGSIGLDHAIVLSDNGRAYSLGVDNAGATGTVVGKKIKVAELIQIPSIRAKRFVDVCVGDGHSLLVSDKGETFYFGKYSNQETRKSGEVPEAVRILADKTVSKIACGGDHFFALTSDDKLYSFGLNHYGQLGVVSELKEDKTVKSAEELAAESLLKPEQVVDLAGLKIKKIAASKYAHSLILTEDGNIYGFGWNDQAQLGLGDKKDRKTPTLLQKMNNATHIAAGYSHSVMLVNLIGSNDEKQKVIGFGANVYNQLGDAIPVSLQEILINPPPQQQEQKQSSNETPNEETTKTVLQLGS